ncbi:MAG: type II secretion system protein GspE, partial [Clostridiales bacterium]|nr:type II secretion system protein GspE [Clostridiales bacterium]
MDFYNKKKKLGDLLIDAGVITEDQLLLALSEQKIRKQKLGVTLIDLGFTTEIEIASALHKQLGFELMSLLGIKIDDSILKLVNDQILRKHMLIPFAYKEDNPNVLRVAMADPLDMIAIDDIAIVTGIQVEPVIATPTEIASTIDRYFGNAEAMAVAERYTKEIQHLDETTEESISNNIEVE